MYRSLGSILVRIQELDNSYQHPCYVLKLIPGNFDRRFDASSLVGIGCSAWVSQANAHLIPYYCYFDHISGL